MTRLLITSAVALGMTIGAAGAQDRIRWQVPQGVSTTLSVVGETMPWVADELRRLSNGDIDLTVVEPGAVIPPLGMFDAVSDGTVNAGYAWAGWERGKVPASPLFGGWPFGLESAEFVAWMLFHGGRELMEETYHPFNVHPVLCGTHGYETGIWFRREIATLEELRGVRFRAAGLSGVVFDEFGMSVSLIPGGEIFLALETGVVDGAEFWIPSVDEQLGFFRVAPYLIMPGWHGPKTTKYLYVNLDAWNGLSDHSRQLIETVCLAATMRSLAATEALAGDAMASFEEAGVRRRSFTDEELAEAYAATQRVFAQIRAEDEMFDRILTSIEAFERAHRPWREMGALPRDWRTRIGVE